MNLGTVVPGESYEANFAVFLGFFQRFRSPIRTNEKLWIVVEGHAMNLPEIQMIGLQPP